MATMMRSEAERAMVAQVAMLIGNDGTGDLGVIVEEALRADPAATPESIAAIAAEMERYAAAEYRSEEST